MSDNHLKTPLSLSLNQWSKSSFDKKEWLNGKSYPASVTEVISSGIVKVSLDVNADPFTPPTIKLPILYPEYIRYPIQVGDKGLVVSADVPTGAQSGLGSTTPDLTKAANLGALHFLWMGSSNWTDATDPNAVEIYAPNGVIIRDTNSNTVITLKPGSLTIDLGGDLTINTNGNNVIVAGGGDVEVNDGGDVIAGGISLTNHTHSGVTTGSGDTGPPV